jgi:hypothetical protein
MTILDACQDPELFGRYFRNRETWQAWFAWLSALFGLPMTADQIALYRQCTARSAHPSQPLTEGWLICGRRAGKSFILALIAVFLACFRSYIEYLGPGERATVMVIATDRRQARVIFRYCRGLITGTPLLAGMIERETADTLDLTNGVTIEVGTASFRSTRGYTFAAVLCDELAFWPTDNTVSPDYEILDAVRPGMSTIPRAMLLCASSPYARKGALWDGFRRWHGKDDLEALVWKAATRVMNPTVPQSVIDRAMERDPASAAAEYLAEFRSDIESFVSRELVEAAMPVGVRERAPISNVSYSAFVDPSGGSSDSMTLAIAHREGKGAVLDAIREIKPAFSPDSVVSEFAQLLKRYRVSKVQGDRYAGEWPREVFRKHAISYEASARAKSDLYSDLLPRLNSREVELLDSDRLLAQLVGLERRTGRGGRDSIDHGPGSHDDIANAVAGCLVSVLGRSTYGMLRDEVLGDPVDWYRLHPVFRGGFR